MNIETEFKKWLKLSHLIKLDLSTADISMLKLAFEIGADRMLDSMRGKYNLSPKDGK